MKNLVFAVMLMFLIAACTNNNAETGQDTNSANHSAHDTATAGASGTAMGGNTAMKDMHQAMSSMMQQMKAMTPTGDSDHDFAMMMKHHHQGAIDMAKAELNGGQDATMKALAQQIINDQQKEISVLDNFMQGHQPSGSSDYGKNAMGMMTDMGGMQMESSSLDAMFASMMIPHHQDAVKMAEAYLKEGKNAELKQVAQNIIATQPKEIEELRTWLANHKGA